jgi:hypothetical protein
MPQYGFQKDAEVHTAADPIEPQLYRTRMPIPLSRLNDCDEIRDAWTEVAEGGIGRVEMYCAE